jgi:hypothetical protein
LSEDYFRVPESRIKHLTSVLTVVGGKVVHGEDEFSGLAPAAPQASPDWSPSRHHAAFRFASSSRMQPVASCCAAPCHVHGHRHLFAATAQAPVHDLGSFWAGFGCGCAF